MKKYRAIRLITLDVGSIVKLDKKQAADRKGRLEALGSDRYKLKESLQFKAGETFGFEGELPKSIGVDAVDPPPAPSARKPAAKPAADPAPADDERKGDPEPFI